MDQPSARRSVGCSMYKSNTLKSPATQQPRLGLVTEGPGTVPPAVGRRPGCSLCSTSATAWRAFGRRQAGEGTGHSDGKGQQVPKGHSASSLPRAPWARPRALPGSPGEHRLCFCALWGQADGVGMNPTHDPPSGDPPADQAPPSCSRCWFPWNTPKAQHRSTLDSSGSEHLPNHTILWPPGAPCTTKAAQSHPSAPSSRTLVLKQLLKSNPECSKNQSFNSFTSS